MDVTKSEMEKVYKKVKEAAEKAKMDAGYSGDHHDGGASKMLSELKMYQLGCDGVFPSKWNIYLEEVQKENDPDWETYKRLKEKFEK